MNIFYPKQTKHGIEYIELCPDGVAICRYGIVRNYNCKHVYLLHAIWLSTHDWTYNCFSDAIFIDAA